MLETAPAHCLKNTSRLTSEHFSARILRVCVDCWSLTETCHHIHLYLLQLTVVNLNAA